MTATPWGEVQSLDELEGGAGDPSERSPELASRPARERLYAAMTAACWEQGFEATTIADLILLSGTSRETFYELFENKTDCFIQTLRTLLDGAFRTLSRATSTDGASPEEQVRSTLSRLVELATAQRATARLCMVEPYTVGAEALEIVGEAFDRLWKLARRRLELLPGREGIPKELSQAIAGGIFQTFYEALQRGEDLHALEEPIWDWALSYRAPPQPLRLRGRRPKLPPPGTAPPFALVDPAEGIIRGFEAAVAEKGYRATTISDIASRSSISQRTFYEHFENKTQVLRAAIDSSGMQMLGAVMPAIRRSPGWPDSVRALTAATTRFLAAEPDLARLREVEIYAAGPEAIAARDVTVPLILQAAIGDAEVADLHPVARRATIGAVYAVFFQWINVNGTDSLPEVAPLLTYLILAPLVGAERACEVAVDSRPLVSGSAEPT